MVPNVNVKGRGKAWSLELTGESYGEATLRAM